MEHRVISHSGCSYANAPLEFFIDEEHHLVARVHKTWLEETAGLEGLTRQIWLVEDQDGKRYRLTYHWTTDFWEVEKAAGGWGSALHDEGARPS